MRKIVKRYMEEIDWSILKLATVIVVLFYGINFSIEYATDTYSTFQEPDTWKWMLYENGRLINGVLYYIIEKLHIPAGYIYKMSYALAIVSLTLAVYILSKLIAEFCDHKYISTMISFLTLSNFFVIEYFLFIEKGMFMVAILLCTMAIYYTSRFLNHQKKCFLVISFCCLLAAVFIYQLMLGLYVVLCIPFAVKYADDWKKFITNNIVIASGYALPMLVAFVVTKMLLGSSRIGNVGNFVENMCSVLQIIGEVSWKSWFHMGQGIFAICVLLMIGGVICYIGGLHKRNLQTKNVLGALYVIAGILFTAFFPKLTGIGDIVAPRTLYPYACLPGILAIYGIVNFSKEAKKINVTMFAVIITMILTIQYLNFNSVFIERYKANQNDKYYCEIIGEKIKEYEEETDKMIDTICFYYDKSVKWYDNGLDETLQSPRAQSCGWSSVTSLNIYLDKNYIKGECEPEYISYFEQFNWDTYSEKQVIFEENVLHLCVY